MNYAPIYQHIDDCGKTRMLGFETHCEFISPIAPLDLPISSKVTLSTREFVKKNYDILHEQIFENKIVGYFVKPGYKETIDGDSQVYLHSITYNCKYVYIPVEHSKISYTDDKINKQPIYTSRNIYPPYIGNMDGDDISELEKFSYCYQVSEFLKQTILILYFYHKKTKDICVIKEGYIYDINSLPKSINYDTGYPFEDGKLIVPTKLIYDNLLNLIEYSIVNNVVLYSKRIVNKFETISNFTIHNNEIISINNSLSIRNLIDRQINNVILSNIDRSAKVPFIYINHNIHEKQGDVLGFYAL